MAITADAQWWIRTDGNDLNGAGFDSTIGGYGTNYSDQAAAQLTLTDLATSGAGSTTLTSATGGFTSAMVGNAIQIVSGTNVTNGYYFVTGYTSSGSVTVDRAPDNGGGGISSGNGKLGGAWASPEFVIGTAATTTPSPLVAGNTVNIRGSGTDNPSSPDYTFSSYRTLTSGSNSTHITFIGYNGRPHLQRSGGNLIVHNTSNIAWKNFKFSGGGYTHVNYPMVKGAAVNCIFDQNGYGGAGLGGDTAIGNYFTNTGAAENYNYTALKCGDYNWPCFGNYIDNWSGHGLQVQTIQSVRNNFIKLATGGTERKGVMVGKGSSSHMQGVVNNTIVNCDRGIQVEEPTTLTQIKSLLDVSANLIVDCNYGIAIKNSGGYDPDFPGTFHKNAFYNTTTANYLNWSGRSGDVILTADPFTDASAGDYSLNTTSGGGAACRGANNPFEFTPIVSAVGYGDIGALQSDPTGAGGGSTYTNVASAKFTRLE